MAKSRGVPAPVDYTIGAEVITDTAVHTITAIASENVVDNNFASATVDSGAHLVGYFTSIQLQNGACIAYKI
jgi:hypothetical protein